MHFKAGDRIGAIGLGTEQRVDAGNHSKLRAMKRSEENGRFA